MERSAQILSAMRSHESRVEVRAARIGNGAEHGQRADSEQNAHFYTHKKRDLINLKLEFLMMLAFFQKMQKMQIQSGRADVKSALDVFTSGSGRPRPDPDVDVRMDVKTRPPDVTLK